MRRHVLLLALPLALPLLSLACDSRGASSEASIDAGMPGMAQPSNAPVPAAAPAPPAPPEREQAVAQDRGISVKRASMDASQVTVGMGAAAQYRPGAGAGAMIIRTATASVEVRELDRAIASVRDLATSVGGYVAGTSMQGGREQTRSATLELKIPATRFDQVVGGLSPVGRVEAVNVDATDVGEEYVDISARVANAKRLEERLIALLATRTGKLDDVLSVERELARVREEIERQEGRMRYLSSRAALNTLTVTLHEPMPMLVAGGNPIGDAFRTAWRNFVGVVAWSIAALGAIVPFALVLTGVGLVGRRLYQARA